MNPYLYERIIQERLANFFILSMSNSEKHPDSANAYAKPSASWPGAILVTLKCDSLNKSEQGLC